MILEAAGAGRTDREGGRGGQKRQSVGSEEMSCSVGPEKGRAPDRFLGRFERSVALLALVRLLLEPVSSCLVSGRARESLEGG